MKNLSGLILLHYQVKNNIFDILIRYKFISHLSSTLHSRIPVYSLSPQFNEGEMYSEKNNFLGSLHRLLEINFLLTVSGEGNEFFFIKSENYNKLIDIEKDHLPIISPNVIMDKIFIHQPLNFLDEIL